MRDILHSLFSAFRRVAVGQEHKFNKRNRAPNQTSRVTNVIPRWQMLGRSLPAEPLCVIPAKHWLHSEVSSRFSVDQRAGAVLL